jgi:hypothetical protein
MFFDYLKEREIFPTHAILKEDIEYKLAFFKDVGFKYLDELYNAIKTKAKCNHFSITHNIEFEYINVLRRHIMSFLAKPRDIKDFALFSPDEIKFFLENGIRNTYQLYENKSIEIQSNKEYVKSILDIVRQRYISPLFFDGIYLAGYRTIEELSKVDPVELSNNVNKAMKEHKLTTVSLGVKDSTFLVEDAKLYSEWLNL